MIRTIVTHTVKDYNQWLSAFNAHAGKRKEYGSTSSAVHRGIENPNEITVLMGWSSAGDFKRFMAESDIKTVMQEAGVTSPPSITVMSEPLV